MFPKDHIDRLADLFRCHEGDPERSAILFLDQRARLCGARLIEGDSDMLELPMREILEDGMALPARQILLVHTHPSGDPRPSRQDVAATRRMCGLLRRQGQRLFDHIILSNSRYFSFRANRLL